MTPPLGARPWSTRRQFRIARARAAETVRACAEGDTESAVPADRPRNRRSGKVQRFRCNPS